MKPNDDPGISAQQDLALRQYDCILRYLASDNGAFWSRSQLFLVANAALVGLVLGGIPSPTSKESWAKLIVTSLVCLVGICLCLIWHEAIKAGLRWIDRWIEILQGLEQAAFGDIKIHRDRFTGVKSRDTAKMAATLFTFVWSVALAYLLVCLMLKACASNSASWSILD
jgi:lysylphosphatidylglycerol synthetase-like protein (DUF2156 family)